jgi:antagonist of KipI
VSLIVVQSPGLLTTVQDLGRWRYGPLGISPSGAADPVALRIGNLLAGNPQGTPGLEMTLAGGELVFPEGGVIALAGADFDAKLDGVPVEIWSSRAVSPGGKLLVSNTREGARCYLCVRGGIRVPAWLGSASTHLLSGLGGFQGRRLLKGDVLKIGVAAPELPLRRLNPVVLERIRPRKTLRVTEAPQTDWFSEDERRTLASEPYRVSEQSNRMGLRLEGRPITCGREAAMITEGVSLGAVQTPPGGQPIILFVEQQTTGGYPKIANVISADLPSAGQLRPRDIVRFEWMSRETARALAVEMEAWLSSESLLL